MLSDVQLKERFLQNGWEPSEMTSLRISSQYFFYKDNIRAYGGGYLSWGSVTLQYLDKPTPDDYTSYRIAYVHDQKIGSYNWRWRTNGSLKAWSELPSDLSTELMLKSFVLQDEMAKLLEGVDVCDPVLAQIKVTSL
jgi:hypothetical protein